MHTSYSAECTTNKTFSYCASKLYFCCTIEEIASGSLPSPSSPHNLPVCHSVVQVRRLGLSRHHGNSMLFKITCRQRMVLSLRYKKRVAPGCVNREVPLPTPASKRFKIKL
ncbi:hypothetical protein Zmor_009030 [Zophobas morio]|uniref:Uncharacterized protein n=1 Tax=Zophobas morio TaxID=2755281 RepID=A0AA38HK46_9CUCU|nr:hypothetical protein Zmor_009030 [Zophobas morio]